MKGGDTPQHFTDVPEVPDVVVDEEGFRDIKSARASFIKERIDQLRVDAEESEFLEKEWRSGLTNIDYPFEFISSTSPPVLRALLLRFLENCPPAQGMFAFQVDGTDIGLTLEQRFELIFTISWVSAHETWREKCAARLAAKTQLQRIANAKDTPHTESSLASMPLAVRRLGEAVGEHLERARRAVVAAVPRDGDLMFAADAALADYIGGLGDSVIARQLAKTLAKGLRAQYTTEFSGQRELGLIETPKYLARWAHPTTQVATTLALALWELEIRAKVEKETEKPPGLLFSTYEKVTDLATTGLRIKPDPDPREDASKFALFRVNPRQPKYGEPVLVADVPKPRFSDSDLVPAMSAELLNEALSRELRLLGSHLVLPFIEWLVERAHRQASDVVTIEDGGGD